MEDPERQVGEEDAPSWRVQGTEAEHPEPEIHMQEAVHGQQGQGAGSDCHEGRH